jgi:HEAT repeat protein
MSYLASHGPKAKGAVPELIDLLKHAQANVRLQAANTLGAIGPDAREAVPALEEATDDANPTVRSAARQALNRIKR